MELICYDMRLLAALESGNSKLIESQAMKMLEEDPNNIFGLLSISHVRLLCGRLEESGQIAKTLASLEPDEVSAAGFYLLSRCAHAREEMDEATSLIYKALSLSPDCNIYLSSAALYHLVRKEYEMALAFANKVLQQEPQEIWCLGIQALAAFLAHGIVPTEQYLDTIMAIEPENPIPYYYRGRLAQERKKPDRAKYWFEKALELEPEFQWVHRVLSEMTEDNRQSHTRHDSTASTLPAAGSRTDL